MAIMLAFALVGCRREPLPGDGEAIRFSVGPTVDVEATKAGTPDDLGYTQIALFGNTADKAVFIGTRLTKTTTTSWEYTPLKYWEQGQTYNFRAVCPPQANIKDGANGNEVQVIYDSLGENTADKYYGNYDLMVATKTGVKADEQTTTSVVPLAFYHACAAVRFIFTKSGNVSGDCTVTGFNLKGISTSGTLTYDNLDAEVEIDQSNWSPVAAPESEWSFIVGSGWDVPYIGPWTYVVPQSVSGATLEYSYVFSGDTEQTVTLKLDETEYPGAWEPGTAYVYKIDIGISTLSVQIEPWDVYSVWVTDIPFPDK